MRLMKITTISRGGQVSVPASVRRRWGTSRVVIEDRGDSLVLRPIPSDPIEAAIGSFFGPGPDSGQMRAQFREEEGEAEDRRQG